MNQLIKTDELIAQPRLHPEPNNTPYGKLIRIEFPKFSGDDVKDWVYRCKQFFKVDGVPDGRKIQLASMHMFDATLVWYQQYMNKYLDNTPWKHFEVEVVKRFGILYDDPIVELKNLKQTGSVQTYQEAFEALLNRVDLPELVVVSMFIRGLKPEAGTPMRMFQATTLSETYGLARMQEATNTILKLSKAVTTLVKSNLVGQSSGYVTRNGVHKPYRLTQRELEDKRAKGQYFYCDQKYAPGHKCSGQLHSIEVICGDDFDNYIDGDGETYQDCVGVMVEVTDSPQITLNALSGLNSYQTMTIRGRVGKQVVHILIDCDNTHSFLDIHTAKKLGCRLAKTTPMQVSVANRQRMMKSIGSVYAEMKQVLTQFDEVFELPKDLPPQRSHGHQIPLMPNTLPINVRPYRHPPNQKDAIKVKDKFPIPVIEELIDELNGSILFSKLDLSKNLEEHCDHLAQVDYLGHIISAQGVSTDPSKIEAMQKWPIPSTLKHLRGFLGLTGYYRRFIKYYASISQPLVALTKKDAFKWNPSAELAYHKLKEAMVKAPVLALPNFEQEFVVETDASGKRIGAVLCQNDIVSSVLSGVRDKHFHDEAIVGHSGAHVTMKKLGSLFYWKGLKKMVKQMTKDCNVCQRRKPDLSAYPGLIQPLPIPERIWKGIFMDFIEKLPPSHGKSVILVVVDMLSKYAHFISLTHPFTASQVAQVFLDQVYKLHGLPESIVSDRDRVFLRNFWKDLFTELKVKLKLSTAYHPQTDGQTEVVNRSLGYYLRCICGEKPKEWAVYCQTPPIHVLYLPRDSRVEEVDRTLQAREESIKVLKFHLNRQVSIRQGQQHKLSPKYYGPFKVAERIREVAYRLELPSSSQIHPVFHISQLKKCHGKDHNVRVLPQLREDGLLENKPMAILERRLGKVNNKPVMFVLIQLTNKPVEKATWEIYGDLITMFSGFDAVNETVP
nr:retrotransposon-related protein [Tanacetum cinerariifolium]